MKKVILNGKTKRNLIGIGVASVMSLSLAANYGLYGDLKDSEKIIDTEKKNYSELKKNTDKYIQYYSESEADYKNSLEVIDQQNSNLADLKKDNDSLLSKNKELVENQINDLKRLEEEKKALEEKELAGAIKVELDPPENKIVNKFILGQATAYGIENGGNQTKTGVLPTIGTTIAVDPNVIPLGSKVKLEFPNKPQYNGVYIAQDTGGAIKGNIIDLFLGSESVTGAFGRQPVNISVLN